MSADVIHLVRLPAANAVRAEARRVAARRELAEIAAEIDELRADLVNAGEHAAASHLLGAVLRLSMAHTRLEHPRGGGGAT